MSGSGKSLNERALQVLTRLQRTIFRKLGEFVVENEKSLARAAEGVEGYGYTLHQLDELFLSKLNLIERSIAELQKSPGPAGSRYRSLCFRAPGRKVEEEVNTRLSRLPDARVLGIHVCPSTPAGVAEPEKDDLIVTVLYYGPSPGTAT